MVYNFLDGKPPTGSQVKLKGSDMINGIGENPKQTSSTENNFSFSDFSDHSFFLVNYLDKLFYQLGDKAVRLFTSLTVLIPQCKITINKRPAFKNLK